MPSSEETLTEIDAAIHERTAGRDALRHSGRAAVLAERLVDRGLTEDEAAAAIRAAENGQPTTHLELLSAEARAAAAEAVQQTSEIMRAFARAMQPIAQAAAATLRQLDEALRAAGYTPGGKPGRRRDRPAWQSPYGPPPRRKR